MLIYLDPNIIRYTAAYEDYILGLADQNPVDQPRLAAEIMALRKFVELDQLADWEFACSPRLMKELFEGNPSDGRRAVYRLLVDAWEENGKEVEGDFEEKANQVASTLHPLGLDEPDCRHLAEAIVIGASWLLTNDDKFVERCRSAKLPLRVAYVSESLSEISRGLFLR